MDILDDPPGLIQKLALNQQLVVKTKRREQEYCLIVVVLLTMHLRMADHCSTPPYPHTGCYRIPNATWFPTRLLYFRSSRRRKNRRLKRIRPKGIPTPKSIVRDFVSEEVIVGGAEEEGPAGGTEG